MKKKPPKYELKPASLKIAALPMKIKFKKLSTEEQIEIRKQNPLYKNIFEFCQNIDPSVRINRVIRDLPTTQVCGGTKRSGMRGEIDRDFDYLGLVSNIYSLPDKTN